MTAAYFAGVSTAFAIYTVLTWGAVVLVVLANAMFIVPPLVRTACGFVYRRWFRPAAIVVDIESRRRRELDAAVGRRVS